VSCLILCTCAFCACKTLSSHLHTGLRSPGDDLVEIFLQSPPAMQEDLLKFYVSRLREKSAALGIACPWSEAALAKACEQAPLRLFCSPAFRLWLLAAEPQVVAAALAKLAAAVSQF
jgi:hypothetical protein